MESAICNHLFLTHSNVQLFHIAKERHDKRYPLLLLNEALDKVGRPPHEINETALERFLKMLEASAASGQSCFWLLKARIFELSLLCAGHYADNGEFSAAGDLLFNPRKVLIHRKGNPHSQVKPRHRRLSEQLNKGAMRRKHLLLWLKHEVAVEVAKPALLPCLFEQIQQSKQIASWYLKSAGERMKKIADTIGFLCSWSVSSFEDFHERIQTASPKTRRFINEHLCRFDMHYFERLGQEALQSIEKSNDHFEFLADSVSAESPLRGSYKESLMG